MNDGQFFVLMLVIVVCACLISEGLRGGKNEQSDPKGETRKRPRD